MAITEQDTILTEPELHQRIADGFQAQGLGDFVVHKDQLRKNKLICNRDGDLLSIWPDFVLSTSKGLVGLEVKATTKTRKLLASYREAMIEASDFSKRGLHLRTKSQGITRIAHWAAVGNFVQFNALGGNDDARAEIVNMKRWAWWFLKVGCLTAREPIPLHYYESPWGISVGGGMQANIKLGPLDG